MTLNKLRPIKGHLNKSVLMFTFGAILSNSQAMRTDYPIKTVSSQEAVEMHPDKLMLVGDHWFQFIGITDENTFKKGKVFHTHGQCINEKLGLYTHPGDSAPDDVYTLPKEYKKIDNKAFSYFWGEPNYCIRNVIVPEGYLSIGDESFCGCCNLTKIDLPKSLLGIGNDAFAKTKITDFEFPENIIYLGNDIFYDTRIKSITAPKTFKFHFYKNEWISERYRQKTVTAIFIEIEKGNVSFFGPFPETRKLKITKPVAYAVNGKVEYKMESVIVGKALWNKVW